MLQRSLILAFLVTVGVTVFAAPANVVGHWSVSLELGSITGHPTLDLKQDGEKVTGTYRGRYGAAPLAGEVKENQIGFTVTMNAEGQEASGFFSGTVDGDKMSGSVEFEGAGEGTWSATRTPARKQ